MKPTTLTVFEVFEKERRYMVPLFQRPYVWSQERQWKPLWLDVLAKANNLLDRETGEGQIVRNHFLGAVVLNQVKTFGRQVSAMEVIDGQQRLTTLQVLLVALRDFIRSTGNDSFDKTLERLTENSCRMEEDYEAYKVWPTSSDRAVFQDVSRSGSPEELKRRHPLRKKKYARKYLPRPNLAEAYLFFYSAIEQFARSSVPENVYEPSETDGGGGDFTKRLDVLVEALTRHLEFVLIELEERDDPQIIFETLNARGEPLLPSDLIRNFVFLEATRQREDVDRLYHTYWKTYDEPEPEGGSFWKELERQGRFRRPRMDLFVFHYLTMKTERDLSITHLFQEFRDRWNLSPRVVEEELRDLQRHARVFKALFRQDRESRVGLLSHRLRILDTSTVYPLLLFLLGEGGAELEASERDGMLTDLESYLVRRMVCGLTAKNYNRVFLTLLRNLRKGGVLNRGALRKQLVAQDGDSVRWPDDAEFEKGWRTTPAYISIGPRRVAMILEALDLQLETSKQEKMHLRESLTVEHVMPQNPTLGAWPLFTNHDWKGETANPEALALFKDMVVHSFGNLTLLTQPLNSSVSNGPFRRKRPEIARQSKLRLNTYFQQFSDEDLWTWESIAARSDQLFMVAKQVWPHPA
jgi:hypothetical protein